MNKRSEEAVLQFSLILGYFERDGLRLSFAVQWDSNPHYPYG